MNKFKRFFKEINCIHNADKIILNYLDHKIENNKVNLHYYHAEWCEMAKQSDVNLGDYLSEIVVKWLCDQHGIDFDKRLKEKKHLYAIGSILQMGYQDTTVWGTGFAFELGFLRSILHKNRNLCIKCVRGPLTRDVLLRLGYNCPEVYGDPAILMPMIYKPKKTKHTDFIIIPHYSVEEETRRRYSDEHIISMNTRDYKSVIDQICASGRVLSSSLHGIILAEAYGIPAVFYQDRPQRFNFKYEDWYQSTGRMNAKLCENFDVALLANNKELNVRRINEMCEKLIKTFPKELWGGGSKSINRWCI